MTEIEQKALKLVNEVMREQGLSNCEDARYEALFVAIEQHEAFRQEVSDAVEAVFAGYHDAPIPWVVMRRKLDRFIITKPNPLVDVIKDAWPEASKAYGEDNVVETAETLRAALAKRGLEIREKE